jgi:hypothetical protein
MTTPTEAEFWIDPDDKQTWFKDRELTIPATDMSEVRFLRNKGGGSPRYMEVCTVDTDDTCRPYFVAEMNEERKIAARVYNLVVSSKMSEAARDEMEQKFMQDLGIMP